MAYLANQERFEEAAETRDRAAALVKAARRHRRLADLRGSGRLRVRLDSGSTAEFRDGTLVGAWSDGDVGVVLPLPTGPLPAGSAPTGITTREEADELYCVSSWLHAEAGRLVVEHCDGLLAEPVDRPPAFRPARPATSQKCQQG